MVMKGTRLPAHLTANREKLAALGVSIDDATGKASAVEGAASDLNLGGDVDLSPEIPTLGEGRVDHVVSPFARLDSDEASLESPAPAATLDEPTPTLPEEPRGLAKREQDARRAQSDMSKTQVKLEATEARMHEMSSFLESQFARMSEQIERLQALQVSVGDIPTDMSPAGDEVLAKWKNEFSEALSVIDARVAPLFRIVKGLESTLMALIESQGSAIADMRSDRNLSQIYQWMPEDRAKQIANSQEFTDWYREQDADYRTIIKKVVEQTSTVSLKAFKKVFTDFGRDTGIDLGLPTSEPAARRTATEPVDTYPRARAAATPTRTVQVSRAPDDSTPLSIEEMRSFHSDMAAARTPEERQKLLRRMGATNINIDGSRAQSLR